MSFVSYKKAGCSQQVRNLLRLRLDLKDSIRRHKKLSNYHLDKIKTIETKELISVEKKLNFYLERAKGKPFKEN